MQYIRFLLGPSTRSLEKSEQTIMQVRCLLCCFSSCLFRRNKPGGVPQHILLSSICSTSSPMNHEPNDTSSLAYLWSIGLTSVIQWLECYHIEAKQLMRWLSLLVDWDVSSQIFWDGIYLPSSMAKVLVSLFSKLPIFRFMVLHISTIHIQKSEMHISTMLL